MIFTFHKKIKFLLRIVNFNYHQRQCNTSKQTSFLHRIISCIFCNVYPYVLMNNLSTSFFIIIKMKFLDILFFNYRNSTSD